MEICVPAESNVVCFRYKPKGLSEKQVEKLNKDILARACNVNHRSRKEDFDWLVAEVKNLGEKLLPEIKGKK